LGFSSWAFPVKSGRFDLGYLLIDDELGKSVMLIGFT
jgi:hypothetical protein